MASVAFVSCLVTETCYPQIIMKTVIWNNEQPMYCVCTPHPLYFFCSMGWTIVVSNCSSLSILCFHHPQWPHLLSISLPVVPVTM